MAYIFLSFRCRALYEKGKVIEFPRTHLKGINNPISWNKMIILLYAVFALLHEISNFVKYKLNIEQKNFQCFIYSKSISNVSIIKY